MGKNTLGTFARCAPYHGESLEPRVLLANLILNCTSGNDSAFVLINEITDEISWQLNSEPRQHYPLFFFDGMVINLLGGNDDIRLIEIPDNLPTTIVAGDGNDTINVGDGFYTTNIFSDVSVSGGAGTDSLIIDDDFEPRVGRAFPDSTIEADVFRREARSDTFFSSIESLELKANNEHSDINIVGIASTTSVTVSAGDGNNNIFVGSGDLDTNINGPLTIFGQPGTDAITFLDTLDSGNDGYTINASSLSRPGAGLISFSSHESLVLNANTGNNAINLNSTTVPVTINSGVGDDTIQVTTGDLDFLNGATVSLSGQAGFDTILLNDQNDTGNDAYLLSNVGLTYGGGSVFFNTPEFVTLNANSGGNSVVLGGAISGMQLTVNGGLGNDTLTGTIASDNVTYDGGSGDDRLVWNGTSSADSVLAAAGGISAGANQVLFTAVEIADIDLAGGNDSLAINLPGFNDDLDNVTYRINFDGGTGTDTVTANDGGENMGRTYSITPSFVSRTGTFGGLMYLGTESLSLNAGSASDTINLNGGATATITNWTLIGNNGVDIFNIGASGQSVSQIQGVVVVDGGPSLDFVNIYDQASTAAEDWEVTALNVTRGGTFGGLGYLNVEGVNLYCQNIANLVEVNSTFASTPFSIYAGGGADQIIINNHAAGSQVYVDSGDGDDALQVNSDNVGTARVRMAQSDTLGSLVVKAGGQLIIDSDGGHVLRTRTMTLNAAGYIDLNDNRMILDYTGASPLANVQSALTSGYAGGAWNGNGIRSAVAAAGGGAAVGYAEASALFSSFPTTFGGQQVDNTAVLIAQTIYGDATLDRSVNLSDFSRLAAVFGQSGRTWADGDFNFDLSVNLSDFSHLAANFGRTASGALIQRAGSQPGGVFSSQRVIDLWESANDDVLRTRSGR